MTEQRDDLLETAERLIAELTSHKDPDVREKVSDLLNAIDVVHRAGLTRMVAAIHSMAGDAFLHRLCGDPAIRLLLMSYDLVAADRRIQTEEAVDAVRGHLHAHGIDVEIRDVVGSVVYARLHVRDGAQPDLEAARRDLTAALREGLLGFQELVIRDRDEQTSGLVQLGVNRGRKPVHVTVGKLTEITEQQLTAVEPDGQPVLLVTLDGEVHALRNRCGDSPLPLQFGSIEGSSLICPWHGCRYDVRTGRRLDGDDPGIQVFPVRIDNDQIQIAIATEPATAT